MPATIKDAYIEDELQSSYIDYAMSVIIGRAIPDARDGLKPAQRRILYAMYKMNNLHNQPTKKSARIVGEVIGKFHPHGDIAVYDTLVRMAQDFSMNSQMVEGQGNMGSVDGDPPAAMRYTEVRLTRLAEDMLNELDEGTVDFIPNFDNTEEEPIVLPGKMPNLLVNGASGIAVGVATSMPPHNINEVCQAVIHKVKNSEATVDDILNIIKGPDFPTGGIAMMSANSYNVYWNGRGQLTVRAKATIDNKGRIVITEIPYNVNKSALIQDIAELVREKRVQGIRDIRDESDRHGISVVIEPKGVDPNQLLNILYKHTQLEVTYPIINLAVIEKSLKSMNILQLINTFIEHRRIIILRRSKHKLGVATDRLHIVEGLLIAIASIDDIIKTIKESNEPSDAKRRLSENFSLSEKQASSILDMKLSRLTRLENTTLTRESETLRDSIKHYTEIINLPSKIDEIIVSETEEIMRQYGRKRKTEIVQTEDALEITDEDMISNDKVTIILTNSGYVKRMAESTYHEQGRGGKGVISINLKEGDYVRRILSCNNKDYLICISNTGRAYWLKAYNIPESSRYSEGKAIVNLLNLNNEKIVGMFNVKGFENSKLAFLTGKGLVKKMKADLFSHPRSTGIRAISMNAGDEIVDAIIYGKEKYLIIFTKGGKAIKFDESRLRYTGRSAMGVRGIRTSQADANNIIAADESGSILTITNKGYGKITAVGKYRLQSRGGKGVINIKTTEKTGNASKALFVSTEESVILINSLGKSITIPISSIRVVGRASSGVRLMRLEDGATIADARLMGQPQNPEGKPVATS